MLRSVDEIRGYTIQATDGLIGKVDDLYFDDQTWVIRYLVVDTGDWLPGRRVLIASSALGQPDWEAAVFPVSLTRTQVKNSPDIDWARPVSRQAEVELASYYRWPIHWVGVGEPMAPAAGRPAAVPAVEATLNTAAESHLRSTHEVTGYHIQARDGEVGHVEDFIVQDATWVIHYMVVDTRNWLPGRKVLVVPAWIEEVDWKQRKVHVDLKKETVRNSPEYDPSAPVNREYEKVFYDYYGRPRYWESS